MWLRPLRPAGPGMSWKETQALLNGRGRGGGSGVSCSGKLLAYRQLFSLGKSLCRWASMAGTRAEGHGHLFGCPSIAPPGWPGRPLSEEPECVGLGPDAQRERVCWRLPGSPVQPHDLLLTRRHPA